MTPAGFNDYFVYGVPDLLPAGGDMEFDDLFDCPLVLPSHASTWRKILDDIAERRGKRLVTTVESESYNVLRAITLDGLACCVLGGCALRDDVAAGRLVARRLINPSARGVLTVARLQSAVPSPAVDAVKTILIEESRKAYNWHEPAGDEPNVLPMLRALPTKVLPQERATSATR
ncbi:LysR substrate-binding domain-containing protein [Novosphingobium colocasiae]